MLAHAQPRAVPDPQAVGGVHRQPDPAGHARQPGQPPTRRSGYKLKPLLRAILTNPLIFESIDEPNLIKPPMVYMVGALRQLDAPLQAQPRCRAAMNNMQQRVYRPPNVAGWEGGMSWLNTNTVQGRFDLITRVQYLKYSNYYTGDRRDRRPDRHRRPRPPQRGVRPRVRVRQPPVALGRHARPRSWPTPARAVGDHRGASGASASTRCRR